MVGPGGENVSVLPFDTFGGDEVTTGRTFELEFNLRP
jgi:hypothetical protein